MYVSVMRSQDGRVSRGRIEARRKEAIALGRLEQLHTYEVVAE